MVSKYWKQFENSGKVEDYLSFLSKSEESNEELEEANPSLLPSAGENACERTYHCDGHGVEAVTGGGV
jgi:hypothetical protein